MSEFLRENAILFLSNRFLKIFLIKIHPKNFVCRGAYLSPTLSPEHNPARRNLKQGTNYEN